MFDLSTEDIRLIVNELDQAIYNHEEWSKRLTRTLVCDLPPDENDLNDDAHRRCLFGQWYYNRASSNLQKLPAFVAIANEHQRMHEQARTLLLKAAAGTPLPIDVYDTFENMLERLRLQIHTLRREFAEMLYNRDPLTGANSRLGLLTALREYHDLTRRGSQRCAIAMMDIDHFKSINDQYGHLAGDKVLAATAAYFMNNSRSYDKIFRYGGEEFVICMPGLSQEQAFNMIERLREGLADYVVHHDEQAIHVTASFGITMLDPFTSVEECLERMDSALYTAKSAGRNCTYAWTEK